MLLTLAGLAGDAPGGCSVCVPCEVRIIELRGGDIVMTSVQTASGLRLLSPGLSVGWSRPVQRRARDLGVLRTKRSRPSEGGAAGDRPPQVRLRASEGYGALVGIRSSGYAECMADALRREFDPTPSAVEELARRLPARARAEVEWFPHSFRVAFIGPLSSAPESSFRAEVDGVIVEGVRSFLRLAVVFGHLAVELDETTLAEVTHRNEAERHRLIASRLGEVDADAADDLREAYEWLRVVFTATFASQRDHLVAALDAAGRIPDLSDESIRLELSGEGGALLRGQLLTIGAVEVVLQGGPPPPNIAAWCRLALQEMHSAAGILRAYGLPIPVSVQIPGFTLDEWRRRRRATFTRRPMFHLLRIQPGGPDCPPGVIEQLIDMVHPEEIWLFGSRARGTARPESDWDLLVIMPDSTPQSVDRTSTWDSFREIRRLNVDVFLIRRSEFEAERLAPGTLAHIVATEGRVIHGH